MNLKNATCRVFFWLREKPVYTVQKSKKKSFLDKDVLQKLGINLMQSALVVLCCDTSLSNISTTYIKNNTSYEFISMCRYYKGTVFYIEIIMISTTITILKCKLSIDCWYTYHPKVCKKQKIIFWFTASSAEAVLWIRTLFFGFRSRIFFISDSEST
jgi:hypothetical protein